MPFAVGFGVALLLWDGEGVSLGLGVAVLVAVVEAEGAGSDALDSFLTSTVCFGGLLMPVNLELKTTTSKNTIAKITAIIPGTAILSHISKRYHEYQEYHKYHGR